MAGRNIIKKKIETAKSIASSFNSTSIMDLESISEVGFSVASSGVTTNTGTLGVDHRIEVDNNNISEWVAITISPVPTFASANAQFLMQLTLPPGQVRMTYTSLDLVIQTLTFPTKAGATDGDYIVVEDSAGTSWAVGLDTTGGAAQTPTGAAWVAADYKDYVDISADTTAADVAASAEVALNALTGFTAAITTNDTAADGTMTLTSIVAGSCATPDPHDYNEAGVGTITGVITSVGDGTIDVYFSGRQL